MRLPAHLPVWAGVGASVVALSAGVYWLPPLFVSGENEAVEWALRLPKERERARIAGFTGDRRVAPKLDPAQDAGVDWVRLDAVMKADAPDGELPYVSELLNYANPRSRAKADRVEVAAIRKDYRKFLPEAEAISRKPLCYLPFRVGEGSREGVHAAGLMAALHMVTAVNHWERGHAAAAMRHLVTALRIARQLQAQDSPFVSGVGFRVEAITMRLVREGLTVRDGAKRATWMAVFARDRADFLGTPPGEPLPEAQFRRLLLDDYRVVQETARKLRAEKYTPKKSLFMESVPVLRLINRLDFVLTHRVMTDSWESTSDWCFAGLAVRMRGCATETRPYVLWKAVEGWDRHAKRVTKSLPRYLQADGWAYVPQRRVVRDTEQALTRAVWAQVSENTGAKVPDDPFAAKPNTPLRCRKEADGSVIWYSVGTDGKDDGGSATKDYRTKIPPIAPIEALD